MTIDKHNTGKLLSADAMAEAWSNLWNAHQLVLSINNRFIEEMQKSRTLGPEDRHRLELWSKAIARAQAEHLKVLDGLNARPEGVGLN